MWLHIQWGTWCTYNERKKSTDYRFVLHTFTILSCKQNYFTEITVPRCTAKLTSVDLNHEFFRLQLLSFTRIKVANTSASWEQHLSYRKPDVGWISLISHYSTFFCLLHHHSSVTFYRRDFYIEKYMFKVLLARHVLWRGIWQWWGQMQGKSWLKIQIKWIPNSTGRAPVECSSEELVQVKNTHPEKLAMRWKGAVKLAGELR